MFLKGIFNRKEATSYMSIFILFFILFSVFQNAVSYSFALSCTDVEERNSLDRCRYGTDDFHNAPNDDNGRNGYKTGTQDSDGNIPLTCLDPVMHYEPFTSPDFVYINNNKYCLLWSLAETQIPYYIALVPLMNTCVVPPDPLVPASVPIAFSEIKKIKDFISWVKQTVEKITKVIGVIGAIAGTFVNIGTTAALGALTNPLIVLVGDALIQAAKLSLRFAWNLGYVIGTGAQAAAQANPVTAAVYLKSQAVFMSAMKICALNLGITLALPIALIYGSTAIIWGGFAKQTFNRMKICGDDWNRFAYTKEMMKEAQYKSGRYYPEKGAFSNSYQYVLNKCYSGEWSSTDSRCKNTLGALNKICDLGSPLCEDVDYKTKDNFNRVHREKMFGGKEFELTIDYETGDCIDPRLDEIKGFGGLGQRYYFKGSDAANFACERFIYKNNGCVDSYSSDGKGGYKKRIITKQEAAQDQQKAIKCEKQFELAKSCCDVRRQIGMCVYDSARGSETVRKANTMCLYDESGQEKPCDVDL
ncbi:MAG: hypothetical protein LBC92_05170, partial [Rickettsiales bacterium]|nr:hypothetical protein [Rickettsiales bacterium]